MKPGLAYCLGWLLAFAAMAAGTAGEPETRYLEEVKPLLTRHCVSCHGAEHLKAHLRLDTAASARKGGESGPSIVPGKPSESLLIQVLDGTHSEIERMPYHRPPLQTPEILSLIHI